MMNDPDHVADPRPDWRMSPSRRNIRKEQPIGAVGVAVARSTLHATEENHPGREP